MTNPSLPQAVVQALLHLKGRARRRKLSEYLQEEHQASERTVSEALKQARNQGRVRAEKVGRETIYALPK